MRRFYDAWYRYGTPPWGARPREELVSLVSSGRLTPCRAIDLGCGAGANAAFLAESGFDVTGVDFAPAAIAKARARGSSARFEVDDLTALRPGYGAFDLLVDDGTFDDLGHRARAGYLRHVIPLARPGARMLLWCFEWELSRLERLAERALPFGRAAMEPGEIPRVFGPHFEVERIAGGSLRGWPRGYAAYLMTRRGEEVA